VPSGVWLVEYSTSHLTTAARGRATYTADRVCAGADDRHDLTSTPGSLPGRHNIHGGRNMLVLHRRASEQIVLNPGQPGEIVVEIVELRGGGVRVGIEAPDSVEIVRAELAPQGRRQTGKGSK